MHRNIAFPLGGELCDKARKRLLKLAGKGGILPRRTYARLAGDLLGKAFRLSRSRRRDLEVGKRRGQSRCERSRMRDCR